MSKLWMYIFLLLLVGLMLRNPGGTAGILSVGGTQANDIFGTLGGSGIKGSSFSGGGVNIK